MASATSSRTFLLTCHQLESDTKDDWDQAKASAEKDWEETKGKLDDTADEAGKKINRAADSAEKKGRELKKRAKVSPVARDARAEY